MSHVLVFWIVYLAVWPVCTALVDRWLGRRGLGEPWTDAITAATVSIAWPIVLWWWWLHRK